MTNGPSPVKSLSAHPPLPLVVAAILLMGAIGGCAGSGTSLTGASRGSKGGAAVPFTPFKLPDGSSAPDPDQVRSYLMSLADSYSQTVNQSLDALIATTKDPARAKWARGQRLATLTVSVTNATGPNSFVGLLDMVVFSTLKRAAVEEHWVPTLLGEEGKAVAEAHRRGEAEAWATASRVLTKSQLADLRRLTDAWQREHPGQYYVGYTRFSDFDAYRNMTPDSPEAKKAGSLFSLLYVDPLAGLDPVARELKSYRALTERLAFIGARLPIIAAYEVDLAIVGVTGDPAIQTFVAANTKFSDATDRFATSVAEYPKALSAEREAAVRQVAEATALERHATIDQAAKALASEREAIVRAIEKQDGTIHSIVNDLGGLADRVQQAGEAVNASTTQTVAVAEGATRRTMVHAFRLVLILLLTALVSVSVTLLVYRLARRKLLEIEEASDWPRQ